MSDQLQDRLTKNLLDLIEANNYYWSVIREKNSIIAQQNSDLKILKQQTKKLLKLLNQEELNCEVLRQQIRTLQKQQENKPRTNH
jgi:hypothetical protein